MKIFKSLYVQVIIAIIIGAAIGYYYPKFSIDNLAVLGNIFIRLIKMMIVPIIFCTIVTGIAGMDNVKTAGRVGLKALIYFEVLTTISLILGLVIVNFVQPGSGMHVFAAA